MNEEIDLSGISWVQLSFVDVFGASHSMQLPVERFKAALEHGEPFDGSSLEGRSRLIEVDMRLRPDPATLIQLENGLGRTVCNVLANDGTPWAGDPRTALSMVLEQVGELGHQYSASAELEFYLLDSTGVPVDSGDYFDESEGLGMTIVREAADRLASYGIAIDSLHHEAGPGQYEIDFAPLSPMSLADTLILAKYIVREVAAEAEFNATFMPRPIAGEAGSGLHLHQRIGSQLVKDDGNLSENGRFFLAGQLAHAKGLSALFAPTVNSYKRLHSGPEAPSAIVWAHVNRGALIRLGPNTEGGAAIEFRGADPSANPYLLIAGLLITGAGGVEESLDLSPAFEEEVDSFDPAATDSIRAELLPRDLDQALDDLLADDVLVDAFDKQLLSRLIDGRRAESAAYRTHVTSWEISRYLDEA